MSYPTIYLEQQSHKKELKLLLKFTYNDTLINLTRKLKDARWSRSMKSWYLDFSEENIQLVAKTFKDITTINSTKLPKKTLFKRNLTAEEKTLLNNFYSYLKGKRYSESTLQTYTFFVADFINFHTKKALDELTNRDVELFIESVFIERNYSVSSQRQFVSALKLFIQFCPQTKINDLVLERPKRSRKLPSVLSQEEVLSIIQSTQNLNTKPLLH